MADRYWELSASGVEEIRTLGKNMGSCMERLEQAWADLAGAAVEHSEGVGIYGDAVNEAIEVMSQVNEVNKEAMERLIDRIERYADLIEEEISKATLD